MSFLHQLHTRKNQLKPTTTILTYPDGRKFNESKSNLVELPQVQFGFVVDTKPDKVPAKITDYIFLGSQDCCDFDVLFSYNIGQVLSVGVEAPVQHETVLYNFIQCLDLPETRFDNVLQECIVFIKNALDEQCNLLVHCNAGVSRSAAVVIGYLIVDCGYTYDDAFNLVKKQRSCIKPNQGFVVQLRRLSNK